MNQIPITFPHACFLFHPIPSCLTVYIADFFLLGGGFNGFLVYRSLSISNSRLRSSLPSLPFPSDELPPPHFSLPSFFLSNVEENRLFCIVILNIVFLSMRQLDCKLHATIDWKKTSRAKVSLLFLQHTDPQHTYTPLPPMLVNVFFC